MGISQKYLSDISHRYVRLLQGISGLREKGCPYAPDPDWKGVKIIPELFTTTHVWWEHATFHVRIHFYGNKSVEFSMAKGEPEYKKVKRRVSDFYYFFILLRI